MTTPTGENAERLDRSLLTDEECPPPCWHGIVPEQSTEQDAREALANLDFVDGDSVIWNENYGQLGLDALRWRTSLSDWRYYVGVIYLRGDTVARIDIQLEYQLTVKDLLNRYGPPDKVSIEPAPRGRCYLSEMIWLDHGLEASLDMSRTPAISEDQAVYAVMYSVPASNPVDYFMAAYNVSEDVAKGYAARYVDWSIETAP